MLAKCRLASTVSVSGHRCSAGYSTGGVRRQEEEVHMLGYAHLGAVVLASAVEHQHELFSWTHTDRRATASRSTEKRALFRVVASCPRCHTMRPEAGCTKPTR